MTKEQQLKEKEKVAAQFLTDNEVDFSQEEKQVLNEKKEKQKVTNDSSQRRLRLQKSGNIQCVYINTYVWDYIFIDVIPLHLMESLIQRCKAYEWKDLFKHNCLQIITSSNVRETKFCDRA